MTVSGLIANDQVGVMPSTGPKPGRVIVELWVIAGLVTVPTTYFFTTSKWAHLAQEVRRCQKVGADGKPTPENFKTLFLPPLLTVANSGTDDQEVVDAMNWLNPGIEAFQARRDNLIVGRGPHDPHLTLKNEGAVTEIPVGPDPEQQVW